MKHMGNAAASARRIVSCKRWLNAFLPLFLLACLSGCAAPTHRLVAVSDQDIAKINSEAATHKYSLHVYERPDSAYKSLLARVSNRLNSHARPLCDYTGYKSCFFQTIYDSGDTVNAVAHDGSKITVYRGLLQYLGSEDEVATVVAHEMGHHMGHHNEQKMQNAMVGAAVTGLITAAILGAANAHNTNYSASHQQRDQKILRDMTGAGAMIGALSYSREEEQEADLLGEYLLTRSGYDLRKGEKVMWLLMQMKMSAGKTAGRSSFGDSHPAGPERLAAWRNVVAEIRTNPTKLPYKAKQPTQPARSEKIAARKPAAPTPSAPVGKSRTPAPSRQIATGERPKTCIFSWQKKADGTPCGLAPTKATVRSAFSE